MWTVAIAAASGVLARKDEKGSLGYDTSGAVRVGHPLWERFSRVVLRWGHLREPISREQLLHSHRNMAPSVRAKCGLTN